MSCAVRLSDELPRRPLEIGDRLGAFLLVGGAGGRFEGWSEALRVHADVWWLEVAPQGVLDALGTLRRVRHRRLRPVLEAGRTRGGGVFWAIACARRPTLADRIAERRFRCVSAALPPFLGAARALERLHGVGQALGCFDLASMGARGDLPIYAGAPPGLTDLRIDQYRLGSLMRASLDPDVDGPPEVVSDLWRLVDRLLDPRPPLRMRSMRQVADALSDLLVTVRLAGG